MHVTFGSENLDERQREIRRHRWGMIRIWVLRLNGQDANWIDLAEYRVHNNNSNNNNNKLYYINILLWAFKTERLICKLDRTSSG
jgi:hypothetical protein